jgi:hypothetical protein
MTRICPSTCAHILKVMFSSGNIWIPIWAGCQSTSLRAKTSRFGGSKRRIILMKYYAKARDGPCPHPDDPEYNTFDMVMSAKIKAMSRPMLILAIGIQLECVHPGNSCVYQYVTKYVCGWISHLTYPMRDHATPTQGMTGMCVLTYMKSHLST